MGANIENLFVVSCFKSVYATEKYKDINIESFIDVVRKAKYQPLCDQIRSAPTKAEQNKLKSGLPVITTSCVVSLGRQSKDVLRHSGLMQIDFDEIDYSDVDRVRAELEKDQFTLSTFYSPSGKIKCIVKVIPDVKVHRIQFEALSSYYLKKYSVKCDPTVKDVNRLMYFSSDPTIYHNPNSLLFQEFSPLDTRKKSNKFGQVQRDAIEVIRIIEEKGVDITGSQNDWVRIIFSLVEIFGATCTEYVHRVSRFYPTYDYSETQAKIEACLKSSGDGVTKDTFFYYASNFGIKVFSQPEIFQKAQVVLKEPKINGENLNKFILAKNFINERYHIRFNEVSLDFEFRPKSGDNDFKNLNENNLYIELQENGLSISLNNLLAILRSDFIEKYDPLGSYFSGLPEWDGIDHIENLASYIKANNQKEFNHHFKKWLVRVVACATIPTYYNKQIFTLVSGAQNTGKSTFCRFLCPPQLKNYIAENISTDKDSRIQISKNLLINQDELSTMSRMDINALKSMLSQQQINERLPYDRKNSIIARRCSFMGSTNSIEFLSDETGSVRWLCFEIERIDWSYAKSIDINKVYAQAMYLLKDESFVYEMTAAEIEENNKRNKAFYVPTLEQIMVEKYFIPSESREDRNFFQSTQLVRKILDHTDGRIRITPVGVGKALKYLGYERIKHPRFQTYGYYIDELKQ